MQAKPLWLQTPLFSVLSATQQAKLQEMYRFKALEPGQILFMEGEPCTGFYVLTEGAIQLTRASDAAGLHPTLAVVLPVNTFAEAALFGDEDFPATATALKESKVYHFPKEPFLAALKEDPALALSMIHSQAIWLRRMTMKVQELSGTDSLERLKGWLRQNFKGQDTLKLPMTKKALAAQLGMTPETLSRSLRAMQDQGILEVEGTVLKRKGRV